MKNCAMGYIGMCNGVEERLFQIAYKKLKSSIYFDKTNLPLRDAIVKFETEADPELSGIDDRLNKIFRSFNGTQEEWDDYCTTIINSIKCVALPKKLKEKDSKDNNLILNFDASDKIIIEEAQYFIRMNVEGHILGIIWLLLLGWKLDEKLENCYGNRIKKTLLNEFTEEPTFSPYLFEPYFEKYESWRDSALEIAKQRMSANDDVLIATLDFKRFYYSLDITEVFMKRLLNECDIKNGTYDKDAYERINNFVYRVIAKYAEKYHQLVPEESGNVLPIGFLPSNIIANYCLKYFDEGLVNGWNPVYYGRYVDDILIVESIPHNSEIAHMAEKGELTNEKLFSYFLIQEGKWKGYKDKEKGIALFEEETKGDEPQYRVIDSFVKSNKEGSDFLGSKTKIIVSERKTKFFYFRSDQSTALLECFKNNISKNKSEFRRMPEDESVFQKDDYSEIFDLKQESVNKLREVESINVNKYQLSKYLGKYQRICGLVQDRKETQFIKDIRKIVNSGTLISNYSLWEKIMTTLVVNESIDALIEFGNEIEETIKKVTFRPKLNPNEFLLGDGLYEKTTSSMRKELKHFWVSGLCRSLSLIIGDLSKMETNYELSKKELDFISEYKNSYRDLAKKYFASRMSDKTMCAILPDAIIHSMGGSLKKEVKCFSMDSVRDLLKKNFDIKKMKGKYKYYPYMVNMYDLSLLCQLSKIKTHSPKKPAVMTEKDLKQLNQLYSELNYGIQNNDIKNLVPIEEYDDKNNKFKTVKIGEKKYEKITVAISSIRMVDEKIYMRLASGNLDRSIERYQKISRLVNDAIYQKADMLILPEACVPFEWLSTIARTCNKNKLAVIAGVEPMCIDGNVYNYTAVILPFEYKENTCSQIFFHLKNHYAPEEIRQIEGYRLKAIQASTLSAPHYELYCWNDFWFTVYCCYEMASITDRALFQSYADAIIAVEWNHDVNYYSNIIESLSRDIHCYCIQVNSSDFGDSRITLPQKTEKKDLIRTKGGKDPVVLSDSISIKQLREFQIKEYELQKEDNHFKPTPPQFKKEVVMKKIKGELFSEELLKELS